MKYCESKISVGTAFLVPYPSIVTEYSFVMSRFSARVRTPLVPLAQRSLTAVTSIFLPFSVTVKEAGLPAISELPGAMKKRILFMSVIPARLKNLMGSRVFPPSALLYCPPSPVTR